MTRPNQEVVRALDDALEALELRGELAPMAGVLLGHRAELADHGECLRRLVSRAHRDPGVRDQLWREGHSVRRALDHACCVEHAR